MKIKNIQAIEVLDSRGNPTIRTFVSLDNSVVASSTVPSGASTGSHEAVELRDNDPKRYQGLGVLKAVNNVNEVIAPKLVNLPLDKLDELDKLMIQLDGTDNKSRLGANATLSVSQALIKVAALSQKTPLWQFINQYYFADIQMYFPKIMFNVVNGGKHANWNFDIQEFIIIPQRQLASESIKIGVEIYQTIKKNLKEKKLSTLVGDEGGFSPALNSNEEVFQLIIESAKIAGYKNEKDYKLAIDAAASEFYLPAGRQGQNGKYILKKDGRVITGDDLIKYFLEITNKYGVFSFEDAFQEDDWENWTKFRSQLDPHKIIIGDDLFCTDVNRMKIGQEKKSANGVIIKSNQIGTIYETVQAIKLAKKNGWAVAVSHRSGETEDSFIADLAYACSADFLKTGAPCRSDRTIKYNRLLEIENHL